MADTLGKGWIPQPDDEQDWIYQPPTDSSFKVKSHVDLRDTHHVQRDIYNQGEMNSCTANAIASALRYGKNAEAWGARNVKWNPSRMFIWYHERIMTATDGGLVEPAELHKFLLGTEENIAYGKNRLAATGIVSRATIDAHLKQNAGSNERYGFKSLTRYGVCSEETWPYLSLAADVVKHDFYAPPAKALDEAKTFVPPTLTYWRIKDIAENAGDNVIKHMEAALSEHYPIVFGFRGSVANANLGYGVGLDNDFTYTGWVKDNDETWGHAVLCVGFDHEKQRFLVLNSWGTKFGNGGYFYMPYRWFKPEEGMYLDKQWGRLPRCDDIWVVKSHMPPEGTLGTDVTPETTLNHK